MLTGASAILKSFAIGRELRRRHQAAGADHHEHHVHDPEHRLADHLQWACSRASSAGTRARFRGALPAVRARRLRSATERSKNDDDALADAEIQERRFVATAS